jgi:sodium pump decarboxylase gamma subunit
MDNLGEALRITGVGVGLVFLSLTLLALITLGLTRVFTSKGPAAPGGPDAAPQPPLQPTPAAATPAGTDIRIVAVIAAALSATMTSLRPPGTPAAESGRGRPASAWRMQGRRSLMESQTTAGRRWRRAV